MDDSAVDDSSEGAPQDAELTIVDTWLEPLGDPACGEDLEYDNDFLALTQAAAGKPGNQFAAAEAPDWRAVRSLAENLFDRTRDLRIGVLWARAMLAGDGAVTLPESLRLIHGLLERHWDALYPLPEDGDAYARINTLNDMCSANGLLGDLRAALVIGNRSIGELRGRDIDIALGRLEARDDESPPGKSQIQDMLRDAVADAPALARIAPDSLASLAQLGELMRDRVGYDSAPDLQPLIDAVQGIGSLMPTPEGESTEDSDVSSGDYGGDVAAPMRSSGRGLGETIDSREDALRAIDMVCEFLERTEPTNPAQMLLRRARRLVNKNFLELVRELAPEALGEVARIMGVSVDGIGEGVSNE